MGVDGVWRLGFLEVTWKLTNRFRGQREVCEQLEV